MRALCGRLHRWLGLSSALFLLVASITGIFISWDHELDEWLNADLFRVDSQGSLQSPLALAETLPEWDNRIMPTFFPLAAEAGHSLVYYIRPRLNPMTGKRFEVGFNQVFVNPVTGKVIGTRNSEAVSLDRRHLMPFIYKLHYSLQLPSFWGIDRWGKWVMGAAAMVWFFDTFLAAYLTLPPRRSASGRSYATRWAPAWKVKFSASRFRLNYSLHLAVGLWCFVILLLIAFTSMSLNLYREVFRPALEAVSTLTPDPFIERQPVSLIKQHKPALDFAQAVNVGQQYGDAHHWEMVASHVFYVPGWRIYGVGFGGDAPFDNGMQTRWVYFDANDAEILGTRVPWKGTAADVFVQLQLPVHSGRILGFAGRVLMSVMGVLISALVITGIIIWWKKRTRPTKKAGHRRPVISKAG
ncbi:PepSY-associated TM helix domain-containing protein [Pokkaliibacter sp. CJK22405]|uniref:PepSY-associated TM helix domain-containing protein n=1 Tax=Pokkaliibacter sp. CJK22405 TaxID=3384615 RepID=UPI0039855364